MIELNEGIKLQSGLLFDYRDPGSQPVPIEDLAKALSNCCRFAGHLPRHYSVAQHSYNTSLIVPEEHAFTALMHDTAEAFTNDIPTPLKVAVPELKELELAIEQAMSEQFGFEFPLPPEVRRADLEMLQIEKLYLKEDDSEWTILDGVKVEHLLPIVDLRPLSPYDAEHLFLTRFHQLQR